MKRLIATLVLTCALSGVSLGADIPTCGVQSSGEIPSTGVQSPGDIPSTGSMSLGDIPGVDLSVLLTVLDLVF